MYTVYSIKVHTDIHNGFVSRLILHRLITRVKIYCIANLGFMMLNFFFFWFSSQIWFVFVSIHTKTTSRQRQIWHLRFFFWFSTFFRIIVRKILKWMIDRLIINELQINKMISTHFYTPRFEKSILYIWINFCTRAMPCRFISIETFNS